MAIKRKAYHTVGEEGPSLRGVAEGVLFPGAELGLLELLALLPRPGVALPREFPCVW